MKTYHPNNSDYRLTGFLAVLAAWVFAIALVSLAIIKTGSFIHLSHIH